MLNSVVKISMMFGKDFEYYTITLGGPFFCGQAVLLLHPFNVFFENNPGNTAPER